MGFIGKLSVTNWTENTYLLPVTVNRCDRLPYGPYSRRYSPPFPPTLLHLPPPFCCISPSLINLVLHKYLRTSWRHRETWSVALRHLLHRVDQFLCCCETLICSSAVRSSNYCRYKINIIQLYSEAAVSFLASRLSEHWGSSTKKTNIYTPLYSFDSVNLKKNLATALLWVFSLLIIEHCVVQSFHF